MSAPELNRSGTYHTWSRSLIGVTTALALFISAIGCGGTRTAVAVPRPKAKPVCLVLSVGAEKGLAHIGVIQVLQKSEVNIQCVFGNSMGALIGGLYAQVPERDLKRKYQLVMQSYVQATQSEASSGGIFGFILLGGLMALSGGTAGPILLAGGAGAGVGAGLVNKRDIRRFRNVLDGQLGGASISELPIQYAAWHQALEPEPALVAETEGNLATAIARSIANPLIFSDVRVQRGARLDPGLDRMSAVPLEEACKLRPDAHFLVSNVTGRPLQVSRAMKCTYTEIIVEIPHGIRADHALLGVGASFDRIVQAGEDSALWHNAASYSSDGGPCDVLAVQSGGVLLNCD